MLAIQSGIAEYHGLYTQGAVASQTPGVFFDSPGSMINSFVAACFKNLLFYACMLTGSGNRLLYPSGQKC